MNHGVALRHLGVPPTGFPKRFELRDGIFALVREGHVEIDSTLLDFRRHAILLRTWHANSLHSALEHRSVALYPRSSGNMDWRQEGRSDDENQKAKHESQAGAPPPRPGDFRAAAWVRRGEVVYPGTPPAEGRPLGHR